MGGKYGGVFFFFFFFFPKEERERERGERARSGGCAGAEQRSGRKGRGQREAEAAGKRETAEGAEERGIFHIAPPLEGE